MNRIRINWLLLLFIPFVDLSIFIHLSIVEERLFEYDLQKVLAKPNHRIKKIY